MYNARPRPAESVAALKAVLADEWSLTIQSFREAPRGFYGETWDVQTAGGRYIAKLDRSPHQAVYRRNLPVLQGLLDQQIPGIAPLIRTRRGALCADFEGGTLALFAFIPGEHTEDYPLDRLFRTLARIYRAQPPEGIERERFGDGILEVVAAQVRALPGDPVSRGVRALFEEKRPLLAAYAERLRSFARSCAADESGFVVTHGDAGGNAILTEDAFTLIDWDHPMYAPPERDAWFFIADPRFSRFDACLAEAGLAYRLRNERIGYYGYFTYFYYLHEYLTCYHYVTDEKIRARCADAIRDYFTSWIARQMGVLDKEARFTAPAPRNST